VFFPYKFQLTTPVSMLELDGNNARGFEIKERNVPLISKFNISKQESSMHHIQIT
jgi:hypothetical protein